MVARVGEKRNAYGILLGKAEWKRPLGRSRRRWENNIKMDLRKIGWGGMDCIDLTGYVPVEDSYETLGSIKSCEVLE
jgi:hypothetical protein